MGSSVFVAASLVVAATLTCGTWDLAPWRASCIGSTVLATGPPGKSLKFLVSFEQKAPCFHLAWGPATYVGGPAVLIGNTSQ